MAAISSATNGIWRNVTGKAAAPPWTFTPTKLLCSPGWRSGRWEWMRRPSVNESWIFGVVWWFWDFLLNVQANVPLPFFLQELTSLEPVWLLGTDEMHSSVGVPPSPNGRGQIGSSNNNSSSENSGNSGSQYALCALGVGLVALGIVMIVWSWQIEFYWINRNETMIMLSHEYQ